MSKSLIFTQTRPDVSSFLKQGFLLSFLGVFLAGDLMSQASEDSIIELENYVITANRIAMDVADVSQSIHVISAETIEMMQGSFATDILKKTSSVDVIEYPGGTSGVSIRGFRPQYSHETNPRTLLLIDGRPVSTSMGNIPTQNIARIEVLKGPASSIYGPSAMGGVINIITKKTVGDIQGSVFAAYGSFKTLESGFCAGGSLSDKFSFDVSLDWIDRGENYTFGDGDDYEVGANSGDTYLNTEFSRLNGSARLGYQINDAWAAEFQYDFSDQNNTGVPGPLSKQKYLASNYSVRDLLRQGWSVDLSGELDSHVVASKVYYNLLSSFSQYDLDTFSSSYSGRSYDKTITEWGIQFQDLWSVTEQSDWILGVDYGYQEEENIAKNGDGSARTYYVPDYDRERSGVFVESITRLLDESLIINAGARYDNISTTVASSNYEGTSYLYKGGTQDFGHFSPRGGLVWKLATDWRLHSSIGTAFIAPASREVAGYYESTYSSYIKVSQGNSDLDPESSLTWDLGLEFSNERGNLDLTYFQTKVDDRIISVNTGEKEMAGEDGKERRIYTYVNANSQDMKGLELSGMIRIDSFITTFEGNLDLTFNATWIDEAKVTIGSETEPVKNIADWKANIALNYRKGKVSTHLNARYNGNRWDKDYTYDDYYGGEWYEFPSYWVYDWSLSLDLNANQKVTLFVNNLADKYYYEKLDYPLEGRNLSIRYQYTF